MDISKEYIKMSDYPKIQEHSHYELGDFMARPLSKDGKAIIVVGYNNQSYLRNQGQKLKYIWLPRQDQIQEMLRDENTSTYELLKTFWEFIYNNWQSIWEILPKHPSSEQLWLAFYMDEKHGKRWDGKKWKGSNSGGRDNL